MSFHTHDLIVIVMKFSLKLKKKKLNNVWASKVNENFGALEIEKQAKQNKDTVQREKRKANQRS